MTSDNNALRQRKEYRMTMTSQSLNLKLKLLLSLLAVGSLGLATFGWFQHPAVLENSGIYVNYGGVGSERYIVIALLLLSAVVIWLPKALFQNMALVLLGLILVEYLLWSISSYQIRLYSNYDGSYDHFFLRGGTVWDIAVLIVIMAVFVCLILIRRGKQRFS